MNISRLILGLSLLSSLSAFAETTEICRSAKQYAVESYSAYVDVIYFSGATARVNYYNEQGGSKDLISNEKIAWKKNELGGWDYFNSNFTLSTSVSDSGEKIALLKITVDGELKNVQLFCK